MQFVGRRSTSDKADSVNVGLCGAYPSLAFIATLPPKPIHSDFQICTYLPALDMQARYKCVEVIGDEATRRRQIASYTDGYLVTGGGREPHYGCFECIPQAAEVDPQQWRLLKEFPGPRTPKPWRLDAVRVWERIEPGTARAAQ